MEDKKCIFGYFVKGELQGWRQDTMGTKGLEWAKIYGYSPEQVEIIKKNTKLELSREGTTLMKYLMGVGTPQNLEGQLLDKDKIIEQVTKTEDEKRSWGEFELRVYEPTFDYDSFEKWKIEAFNANLPEPLEVHRYKIVENEN